jgi:2-dehydropantoate 2-reductase
MWTKFVFIAPMSGLGGVTRVPVGSWRTVPKTRIVAERAVREVIAVAAGAGVNLSPDLVEVTMGRYDALPPAATSSLQRDVMEGKPSELDAQLGAVVRLGARYGVATPLHEWMYSALLPAEKLARGR